MSYLNRMWGVKYENLNNITKKIWNYCENKRLYIFSSYINTKDNIIADQESRLGHVDTEYELSQCYFTQIGYKFYKPNIDLFATRLNSKCQKFVSWKPEPDSVIIDAFTISWTNLSFYTFPLFSMVAKAAKI